ncbi:MAG: molybdenum cofactor biosynthesis protein B, partial [Phycisphaerales bacterium]
TGISTRDTTIEVVRRLLTVELEGFGELFRMLSYQQVQAAAMLSRAVGGLVVRDPQAGGGTFIFALPGSTDAVELAVGELIGPQLAHLVWQRGQ